MKYSIVKSLLALFLTSFFYAGAQHTAHLREEQEKGLEQLTDELIIYFFPVALNGGIKATSAFGFRSHPVLSKWKRHSGIDIASLHGTSVLAAGDGQVLQCGYKKDLGYYVTIDHGVAYTSTYGHLSSYSVLPGMRVIGGMEVGRVGSTGLSTGPHLHFTVKKNGELINPQPLLLKALTLHNIK